MTGEASDAGTATARVVRTRTTSSATQAGFRRQSKPAPAPTAVSRAIASASVDAPANTMTATVVSAMNLARYGSAIMPPASAATARHGMPTPNTVPSVAAEIGSLA